MSTANWEHYGNRLLMSFLLSNRYYKTIPMKACYFSIVLFVNASTYILSFYHNTIDYQFFLFLSSCQNEMDSSEFYSHTSSLIPQSEFQYSTDSRVKPHLPKEFLKKNPPSIEPPFVFDRFSYFLTNS